MREECKRIAKNSGLFNYFHPEEAQAVCSLFEFRKYKKGEILFNEGDPGDFIAFLAEGRVQVKKQTEFPDKHFVLAVFGPGCFIGEQAVSDMKGACRGATVTALEDCQVALLHNRQFEELMERFPASTVKLLRSMLRILGVRLRAANKRMSDIF